jgi:cell pole-organizing protein PopZ
MSKIISLFIALALVAGPAITLAQGGGGGGGNIPNTDPKKDQKLEQKTTKEQEKEQKLQEKQDRARSHADEVFSRLDNAIERLSKLLARVNARIAKEEALNVDVSKAKVAAADAQKAIDNAVASIAKFRTQVVAAATSTKPIQSFAPIKTGLKAVNANIKLAQKKIIEAIKSLRDKPETTTATSTNE